MKHLLVILGLDEIIKIGSAILLAVATAFTTRYFSRRETEAKLRKDTEEAHKIRAEKDVIMGTYLRAERDNLVKDMEKLLKDKEKLELAVEILKGEIIALKKVNEEQAIKITYLNAHQSSKF